MNAAADPVVIGTLGRSHGVRGDVRARATGPTLAGLPEGTPVQVTRRDGTRLTVHLAGVRSVHDGLILTFAEVDAREAAAELSGGVLRVDEATLAALTDPDEFYVRDLEGCRVRTDPGDRDLGVVAQVHAGAANDVLEVASESGTTLLVPFTRDAVVRLSLDDRLVVVRADLFDGGDA